MNPSVKSSGIGLFLALCAVLCPRVSLAESLPAFTEAPALEEEKNPSDMEDPTKVDYVDGLAIDLLVTETQETRKQGDPTQAFVGRVPRISPIAANKAYSVGLGILPNSVGRKISEPQLEGVPPSAQNRLAALMQAQEWDEAYTMLEDILMANPGQTNLIHQAAILASLAKRYDDANRYYSQHVKRFPRDDATLSAWSSVLLYMGRYDQARSVAERALTVNPANLHAHLMSLCIDLGQSLPVSEETLFFWKRRTLNDLAMVAGWLSGDSDKFQLGLSDIAWRRLCEITLGYGSHENLEIIPETIQSAAQEMEKGKWIKALVYFDLGQEYGLDGVEFRQNMARCYFEVGNQVDALKIMHGLTLEFPDSSTVWYNYGFVLVNFRIYDEAAMAFKRAHELAPDSGEIYFALACSYIGMDQQTLAWGILDLLAKTHPQNMQGWIEGDQPYLIKLRAHPRYPDLMAEVKKRL